MGRYADAKAITLMTRLQSRGTARPNGARSARLPARLPDRTRRCRGTPSTRGTWGRNALQQLHDTVPIGRDQSD